MMRCYIIIYYKHHNIDQYKEDRGIAYSPSRRDVTLLCATGATHLSPSPGTWLDHPAPHVAARYIKRAACQHTALNTWSLSLSLVGTMAAQLAPENAKMSTPIKRWLLVSFNISVINTSNVNILIILNFGSYLKKKKHSSSTWSAQCILNLLLIF